MPDLDAHTQGERPTLAPAAEPERIDALATRPPRPRRRRLRVLVGVAGAVLACAGVGLLMSRQPPSWWRSIDIADPAIIATAARVENGATTQLTMIRAADDRTSASPPWTIALKATDASAWLATRLRPWLESQDGPAATWPKGLEQVQVEFDDGAIIVGARVRDKGGERVVSASVRPEFRDDGGLWMPASWVTLGRLNLPPSWVLPAGQPRAAGKSIAMGSADTATADHLTGLPQARELWAALGGDRPAMVQPIVKIGDGRRVRILELRPEGGVLYVTCQTLPREATRAGK